MGSDARLDDLLRFLVDRRGSDLHLKVGSAPHVRIDGDLQASPFPALTAADTERLAYEVLPSARADEFDVSGEADVALDRPELGRFRVNVYRQRGTIALVLRAVTPGIPSFETLGLPPVVRTLASEQRGLVLVTGPTGSGKTTTIASMIDHINATRAVNIVTIEDPIEVLHRDKRSIVSQREIGNDTAGFAEAMRRVLRQDPDVIFVGEMRDPETVWAALAAAETGHLVLSTLHTTNAVETVNRIVDFFPADQHRQVRLSLATTLRGVVSQRLVTRAGADGGRVPVVEVLVNTGRVFDRIADPSVDGDSIEEIMADGEFYGMQTFDQSVLRLLRDGVIGMREATAAASSPSDLRVAMQREGVSPASL
ncbi:MAG TPA: PilT/PilU family type 4a pilus ATPase [Acidimicrobiales bacterium]|nr:PilT/PilU family type 4a pilus ATPase [Acidimicrobiales bacterium]